MKHETGLPSDVSRETRDRLDVYVALLQQWAPKINLISRRDLDVLWSRHIADCLQLGPFLVGRTPPLADLGSGAGFPGLVLAIAFNHTAHLIESDHRKAAFLREAARQTGAPVSIHAERIEAVSIPPVSTVTARALAPLPDLLAYAHRLLSPGGVCLFLKGQSVDQELTAAGAEWHMQVERVPSHTDRNATILRISELARVRHDA